MNARDLGLWGLLAGCALLCRCTKRASHPPNPWASLDARYASWEPTTNAIPAVRNRKLAIEYFETSLHLWKESAYSAYIYTRARQLGERELEITAYQVTEGRVTQRTLVRLDPQQLSSSEMNNLVHRTTVWHESEGSLGSHEGGFPTMTMAQLYASCRRDVLATHPELPVRMHFDMSGFLQHCGFAPQDCDDCAAVSVQSVAKSDMPAAFDLRRNLCTNYDGLASTRQGPSWTYGCELCRCESGAEFPQPRQPPGQSVQVHSVLANENEELSSPASERSSGLGNICDVDPAACPHKPPDGAWGNWGEWQCMTLLMADCDGPAVPPPIRAPICVGKATPSESNTVAHARCARAESAAWAAVRRASH